MRAHVAMLQFKIGDRVTFQPNPWETVEGILTRYNKKTVTVIDDSGRQWNVSPGFLKNPESVSPDPAVPKRFRFLKIKNSKKTKIAYSS